MSRPSWTWACKEIRKLILLGKLKSGTDHNTTELRKELSLERTPTRLALNHLKSEGLVEIFPKKGFRVRGIRGEDLQCVVDARLAIECLAASELWRRIHHPSDHPEKINWDKVQDDLVAIQQSMEGIADQIPENASEVSAEVAGLFIDFLDLDIKFHATIASSAKYEVAVCFLRKLHNLMLLAVPTTTAPQRMRDILDEHARIIKAFDFGTMASVKAAVRENVFGFCRMWKPFEFLEKAATKLRVNPSRRRHSIRRRNALRR